jgi:alginate O-acetyltransferase complex protein AlgJ
MERHEPRLSREEIAKREIGRTDVNPTVAWMMVVLFLVTIAAVPAIQSVEEVLGRRGSGRNSRWPGWCGIASAFDGVSDAYRNTESSHSAKLLAANARLLKNIHEYEKRLEDHSILTHRLLGPTQYWLTRLGGLGNEKAYVGLDQWLFYRPGIDYITGPGFLARTTLARRSLSGNEFSAPPHPDPRPAIIEFHRGLKAQGIQLVLMPTPDKAMIEPDEFSTHYQNLNEPLQNPSFEHFRKEMESAGVLVFNAAPILMDRKLRTGHAQFLKTDTHWAPDAVETVAERLREFIEQHIALPDRLALKLHSRSLRVSNLGDVAVMIGLPVDQDLFPTEIVTIRQVLSAGGEPWRPEQDADILLLGDSFTNIYSMAEMNWGEAAGLAERLSLLTGRPIDRIAQNDSGAYATRQALALDLARGNNRISGKRVLIWQFAIRELAVGDWKLLPLAPARPAVPERGKRPDASLVAQSTARGKIQAISPVPEPGSVPYRDAIVAVHLVDVRSLGGTVDRPEIVVYLWGMRDNRLTSAAQYRPGQTVAFELTPWDQAQKRYGRFTRIELDDPDFRLIDLPTYWSETIP